MKFNDFLENLSNYEPGKDIEVIAKEYGVKEVIKLASNENPLGTAPSVQEVLKKNANKAHLYPDDSMSELKAALARKFKLSEKNIIIGAGSDQIIEFAVHAKLNKENAFLQAGTTFAMYEIYAKQKQSKIFKTKSITHDLGEFKSLYEKHKSLIKLIFLCSPNNPLGECLNACDIENFIASVDKDCLVVIDAAYNEFAGFKDEKKQLEPEKLIKKFDNVLYLGTFSKLYGLGGLRVGYGLANEQIIAALYKLRAPFNVTNLSLKAAAVVLDDENFLKATLENNFSQMKLYEDFAAKFKLKFIPSYTYFINYFFDTHDLKFGGLNENDLKKGNLSDLDSNLSPKKLNSSEIALALLKKGIIIRDLKSYGLNAIRITIGKERENARFFEEFERLLKA